MDAKKPWLRLVIPALLGVIGVQSYYIYHLSRSPAPNSTVVLINDTWAAHEAAEHSASGCDMFFRTLAGAQQQEPEQSDNPSVVLLTASNQPERVEALLHEGFEHLFTTWGSTRTPARLSVFCVPGATTVALPSIPQPT